MFLNNYIIGLVVKINNLLLFGLDFIYLFRENFDPIYKIHTSNEEDDYNSYIGSLL